MKGTQWLLVDAGGFNAGAGTLNKFKAEYILKGLTKMGYHAINAAQRDFAHGALPLVEQSKKDGVPLISANAYGEKGNRLLPAYRIVRVPSAGSKRELSIGVIGVSPSYELSWQPPPGTEKARFADPVPEVQNAVSALRKQCDAIVLLTFMTWGEAHELVEKVEGIHVVVVGNSGYQNQEASLENGVLFLPGGRQGKLARVANAQIDEQGVTSFSAKDKPLDDSFPDDPEMVAVLKEHKKRLEEWRASLMQNPGARPK
ncbi:MAG: hypothetical protein QHJ34_00495 [bacterium]|jgi:2',3'-cyclic-nucleotide 2'-phosphodiesterase (5'-nucleotidase family)|nr:hypothetical protein [candidate division KSB1 bacterium]MDH7558696.1 hypothetical protein [bacterium]